MDVGKRPLIVILGPTAAGKSDLAIYLAHVFDTEIISADSMQIYMGMDIGTAKPSSEEMAGIPHHMISIIEPGIAFSVGEYVTLARPIIDGLHGRGKIPVVAGGTGLYVRAIVDGLCDAPRADWALRKKMLLDEEKYGKGHLYSRLREVDPLSAGRIRPNDSVRVIRALEVYELRGTTISELQEAHSFKDRRYNNYFVGLTMERGKLYRRIEKRVDRMVQRGLEAEVRKLVDMGYEESLLSSHGLGYKQFAGYIKGMYSLEEAIRLLKRDTRRYAKRQLTWFRHDERIRWYSVRHDRSHMEEIAGDIRKRCS